MPDTLLLESVPAAAVIVDARSGAVIAANCRAETMFGGPIRRMPPEGFTFSGPDGMPCIEGQVPFLEALAGGRAVEDMEVGLHTPEGPEVTLLVSAARTPDAQGGAGAAVCLFRDITEQKKREDRLRKSAATNDAFLDAVPDLWFLLAADGTFLDYRAQREADLLLPPDAFLGKKISEMLPATVADQAMSAIRQVLANRRAVSFEYELTIRGHKQHFEVRICFVDEDELMAVVRDISDRKAAEEALRASEQRFHAAAQTANDLIYEWCLTTNEVKAFGPIEEHLGYAPGELTADIWLGRVVHPDDREAVRIATEELLRTGAPFHREYRVVRKDGVIRDWLDRGLVLKDADGRAWKWIGVATDITEQRAAERALRESEERFRVLFETMSQGVIYRDMEGRLIAVNPAALKILELDPEQLQQFWPEVMIAEDGSILSPEERPAAILRRTGKAVQNLIIGGYQASRGQNQWLSIDCVPLFRAGECAPSQMYTMFRDITAQKRMEERLRDQNELLQAIFDHIPVMIAVWDDTGKPKIVNREWERVLGWRLEEAGAIDFLSEAYPDPAVRRKAARRIAEANREWADYPVRVRDGSMRDVAWSNIRLSGSMVISIGQDITPYKEVARRLRETEARFRTLFESNVVGIAIVGFDGGIRSANDESLRLMGCARTDLDRGKVRWPELTTEEHWPLRARAVAEMKKTGVLQPVEIEIIRFDGGRAPVLIGGAVLAEDPESAICFLLDLSERKRVEEMRARLAAIVESSDDAMIGMSVNSEITSWNSAAAALYGYAASEALGRPITTLMPPEEAAAWPALFFRIRGGERLRDYETIHLRKDGRRLAISLTVSPIRDRAERISGYAGVARDISESKRVQQQLRDSQGQLRRLAAHAEAVREEERTRIAREIHDQLGQMLTVLKMDLERLAAKLRDGSATPPDLESIVETMTGYLAETAKAVKQISAELRPGVLDHLGLAAAIEWQAQDFQSRTGISCTIVECPRDFDLGEEQSTGVFRIFQEILTNVMRHAQATAVRIHLSLTPDRLVLTVGDNGKGITPDQIRSFQSLGLLGMRERALLLGGTIRFKGRQGRGTTVTLQIPIRRDDVDRRGGREAQARTDEPRTAWRPANRALRVLLADDHPIFRRGLRDVLIEKLSTVVVGEAKNGDEVIERVRRWKWDLLILDIEMPGKSGIAVLRALRTAGYTMPILVMSAHCGHQFSSRVVAAGGSGYMLKSQASSQLVAAVSALLARKTYFPAGPES